jgi:type I restriction enzyme, S subunit
MTWQTLPLSELLREAKPGFACGEDPPDGIFQFRMNNITTEGTLDLSKKRRVPKTTRNLAAFLVEPGDILFNATNSPELVGKSAFFPGHDEQAVFSNHFLRLRPNTKHLDGRFLARWLTLQFQRRVFEGMCRQWVNQATVGRDSLLALKIPVPPLAEQRRIAEVLDRAEALRAKRRAALAELDTLTQAIFLERFGDPIQNTKGYRVLPLIDLVDPQRPISYGILMPGPDQNEGVKYLRVVDMKNGGIELSGIRKTTEAISYAYRRSLLKPGDLLMSIRGHVGRLAIVPAELEGANITQDTARLAVQAASPIFVRECLRTDGFQGWMAKHTKGVAVRGINLGDVKRMPIILPPKEQRDGFASQVVAIEKLKSAQSCSLAELDALFAALQHRAFRGELFTEETAKGW